MSLLSQIVAHLEADPRVVIGAQESHRKIGLFAHVMVPVAPCDQMNTQQLQELLQGLLPMQPFRSYDFFGKPEPWRHASLIFIEEIGSETISRTFSVDDATSIFGKQSPAGQQEPFTQVLERHINVQLFTSPDHVLAQRHFRKVA